MKNLHYILKDGEPIPEPDLLTWAKWWEDFDNHRRVAITMVDEIMISTVFLGMDHSFFGDTPILFETMIFGGENDQYQERYTTLEQAMIGHEKAVSLVKVEK